MADKIQTKSVKLQMAKGGGQRKLAKFLANGWTIASQTQLHPFGDKLTLFTLTKGA